MPYTWTLYERISTTTSIIRQLCCMHYLTCTLGNRFCRSCLTSVFLYVLCFNIVLPQLSVYTYKSSTSTIRSPWGSLLPNINTLHCYSLVKTWYWRFSNSYTTTVIHIRITHTALLSDSRCCHLVSQNMVTGTPNHRCLSTPTSLVMT